ncbi:MAG: molecular chaperone DnaK [Candidatus Binatia bacterium]|nr:MAG: molecular chaperone DnaK [Candidatus Binatia bacterium]
MRKAFLKAQKQRLLELKKQLLREIDQDLREGREGRKDEAMDAYDLASEERDREIHFILSDREREKLQAIEDALERIENGTYGICEDCEGEIAQGRLEALPFTRLCVSCQQEREREAKLTRSVQQEDRLYRKLGATDLDEENS